MLPDRSLDHALFVIPFNVGRLTAIFRRLRSRLGRMRGSHANDVGGLTGGAVGGRLSTVGLIRLFQRQSLTRRAAGRV